MTEDEMYDMMIECVKAVKDKKRLQFCTILNNEWLDVVVPIIVPIVINISKGVKYRVKPEPKTVRARMYWYKYSNIKAIGGPSYAIDDSIESIVHSSDFHSWAGDEQILTVPEV